MTGVLIDTRGLSCPLHVLKVRKIVRDAPPGTAAEILATDPLAEQDLRDYCDISDCRFVSVEALGGGVQRIVIQKL
jgi:tRNA 2-thiouridine synthesizing protein A